MNETKLKDMLEAYVSLAMMGVGVDSKMFKKNEGERHVRIAADCIYQELVDMGREYFFSRNSDKGLIVDELVKMGKPYAEKTKTKKASAKRDNTARPQKRQR